VKYDERNEKCKTTHVKEFKTRQYDYMIKTAPKPKPWVNPYKAGNGKEKKDETAD